MACQCVGCPDGAIRNAADFGASESLLRGAREVYVSFRFSGGLLILLLRLLWSLAADISAACDKVGFSLRNTVRDMKRDSVYIYTFEYAYALLFPHCTDLDCADFYQ